MGHFNVSTGEYESDGPTLDGGTSAPGVTPPPIDVGAETSGPSSVSSDISEPAPVVPLIESKPPTDFLSSVADTTAEAGAVGGSSPVTKPAAAPAPVGATPLPGSAMPDASAPPEVHTTVKGAETTHHLVNQEEIKADQAVASTVKSGEDAILEENKNRLKQAEIDALKKDIDAGELKEQQENARKRLEDANRRKAAIDADVAKKQAAYEDAAKDKNFWKTSSDPNDKNDIHNRQNWSMSLLFGNIAVAFGAEENPGRKLMDKAMGDWVTERDKNLARLEREATKAGGLKEKFWQTFGEDAKAQKELQDAAGYASMADKIAEKTEKEKALIGPKAVATNMKAVADYRQISADKRQGVVAQRFNQDHVSSGGGSTTTITDRPVSGSKSANNDLLVYGVGGEPIGQARTPKEAEKVNSANTAFRDLDGVLDALQQSYEKHGVAYNPLSTEYQNQKALKGAATIAYKSAAELGALSGPDMGLVNDAIGGAWVGKQGAEKLRAARNTMGSSYVAKVDSQGLPGAKILAELRKQTPAPKIDDNKNASAAKKQQADKLRALINAHPNDHRVDEAKAKLAELEGSVS
jgi:hypothetical protein